ncbi:MAG TPA: hypothetical protein VN455_10175 [Methanotrichaceae archaeon]|nr:hypothetical protein [Methanotrichaceae archaeon]
MAPDISASAGQIMIYGLVLMVGLLVISVLLHHFNLARVYRRVSSLSGGQTSKDKMLEELSISQGSNFTAIAVSAWSLFFVALAYFYFLTPAIFQDYNYFKVAALASSPIGFFIFGLLAMVVGVIVAVVFARFYSYYEISGKIKRGIMATFLLLGLSLVCSAYLGTLYPGGTSILATAVAFISIFASLLMLLSPVYLGTYKVIR